MTKQVVTWETLRTLCDEAGLGDAFRSYEEAVGSNIKSALVNHFGKANQYLQDPHFRAQVDELIGVIVSALTHSPAAKPKRTVDMEDLTKLFGEEAESAAPGLKDIFRDR